MVSRVYTYIPNYISYIRVVLVVLSFYYIWDNYKAFFVLYAISEILDMADGNAARYFDQCSRFGAVLDMVTDRSSTLALIIVLTHFYTDKVYIYTFLALCSLDLVSHFARLYSQLSSGLGHKVVQKNHFWLLRIYYENKYFLAGMCAGNEGFFLGLYLLHFVNHPLVWLLLVPSAPICFTKQLINVIQLVQSMKDIVELDDQEAAAKKGKKK